MTYRIKKALPFQNWPSSDQIMFVGLTDRDALGEAPWADLAGTTIERRQSSYARFLGFISREAPELLAHSPPSRVTRETVRRYTVAMLQDCTEITVSTNLQWLYWCIRAAYPSEDLQWLLKLSGRIRRRAVPLAKPYIFSVDLYRLGLTVMQEVEEKVAQGSAVTFAMADRFQDGLMICCLTEAPMRLNGFANLRLGGNLMKIAGQWRVYLSPDVVKTRSEEDFEISAYLSRYLDRYIELYRPLFPESHPQQMLWLHGDRPMSDKRIRERLKKHTKQRLGVAITPHGFRRAAAAFLTVADPNNAMSARDLLHHTNFSITEKYYVRGAKTRRAARVLADAIRFKLNG